MEKSLQTDYVTMTIDEGLFRMVYDPLDQLDLEIAERIVKDRVAFKEGVSYPSLFDVRAVKSISKEARDYMANEGNDLVEASALLINSAVLRMMGNFYISVNKPQKPTQLFNAENKAIDWLNQFK